MQKPLKQSFIYITHIAAQSALQEKQQQHGSRSSLSSGFCFSLYFIHICDPRFV